MYVEPGDRAAPELLPGKIQGTRPLQRGEPNQTTAPQRDSLQGVSAFRARGRATVPCQWKKKLFSEQGRALREKLSLAPWASRRRKELLELLDQLDPKIAELTAAVEQEARQRPEVLRLMTHPGVGAVTGLAFPRLSYCSASVKRPSSPNSSTELIHQTDKISASLIPPNFYGAANC